MCLVQPCSICSSLCLSDAQAQSVTVHREGTDYHANRFLWKQGLPVVQSPGEGEAMCAALNAADLVDACATFDGDVLLFGAHTVYHTLKLQVPNPCLCIQCCTLWASSCLQCVL